MSSTGTQTQTFTSADIRKVVDFFAADFAMKAESTGLWTVSEVQSTVADIKIFAENRYLVEITLILRDKEGNELRGSKYRVSESASGWTSEQPGNALWPRTPNGKLSVTATLSDTWWNLKEGGQATFKERAGMQHAWGVTTDDTSLSKLTASTGQRYSSRGYGLERTNYS